MTNQALAPSEFTSFLEVLARLSLPPNTIPHNQVRWYSQRIGWTSNASATTIQDVSVDHRCIQIAVSKKFLYCSDIIAIFQQMSGE